MSAVEDVITKYDLRNILNTDTRYMMVLGGQRWNSWPEMGKRGARSTLYTLVPIACRCNLESVLFQIYHFPFPSSNLFP